MTDNNHPITPPPELVAQWVEYAGLVGINEHQLVHLATQAARWGSDQELEACCEWLDNEIGAVDPDDLRAERRSKPPSLKEQALEAQRRMWSGASNHDDWDLVRRALEQLDD